MNLETIQILEQDSVNKALTKLAGPAVIAMLVTALYNIVDTVFIGAMGITSATAAISVVFPLFILIGSVGLIFGVGGGSSISRKLGEKQFQQANTMASISMITIVTLSILFTISCIRMLPALLRMLGATPTVMPFALRYSRIIVLGSLFTMSNMTLDCFIKAEGNAFFGMKVSILGFISNCILNPLLMFGFGMGLEGAAYATVISQGLVFLIMSHYYFSGKSLVKLTVKSVAITKEIFQEILKIGIPAFIKQLLISISVGMANIAAAPYGDGVLAAMGITMRFTALGFMIIVGFTQGFLPLAAYSYGAGNINRLLQATKTSIRWTTVFAIIFSVLIWIFPEYLITFFSKDSQVIALGVFMFRTFGLSFILLGFIMTYSSLFEAIGRGKHALLLAISRQGIFYLPTLFILPLFLEMNGIILSLPIADAITFVLTLFLAGAVNKEFTKKLNTERAVVLATE